MIFRSIILLLISAICLEATAQVLFAPIYKSKTVTDDIQIISHRSIYLDTSGSDSNSGTINKPFKTLKKAIETINKGRSQDRFSLHIGPGEYKHLGEIKLLRTTKIIGAGKDQTSISLSLGGFEAGIRIQASNSSISDVTISPTVREFIPVDGTSGGRAEYGTGITVGNYLEAEPLRRVENISLNQMRIVRPSGTRGSPGISLLGRIRNINIKDIEFIGTHSTAIVIHWGGYNNLGRSPFVFQKNSGYKLIRSFHPNDISIKDIYINNARRAFVISSSYNIHIENVWGKLSSLAFILPGDEIDFYASYEDKGYINKDITMTGFDLDVYNHNNQRFFEMSSQGTSKIDYTKTVTDFINFELSDLNIERLYKSNSREDIKRGLSFFKLRGRNLLFENISFGKFLSEFEESYILYSSDSHGILLRNLSGESSNKSRVQNSTLQIVNCSGC